MREEYITRTINGKKVKFSSKVWAVVPKTYTARLCDYDDLPWFKPYYKTKKEALAKAREYNRALKENNEILATEA